MNRPQIYLLTKTLAIALAIFDGAIGFQTSITANHNISSRRGPFSIAGPTRPRHPLPSSSLHVSQTEQETEKVVPSEKAASPPSTSTSTSTPSSTPTAEETTEKYGLEAGLFQSLKSNDGGESAKSLLAKYGIAYLATSIPLALVSFVLCYLLVDNGVDVGALLAKVGIQAGDAGEKAGTFAIAYAAHKAASPIRFPPTVLLTPMVAKLIGKEPNAVESADGENQE